MNYRLSEVAQLGSLTSIYAGTSKSPRFIRESLIEAALNVGICLFVLKDDNSVEELALPEKDWTSLTKVGRVVGLDSSDLD